MQYILQSHPARADYQTSEEFDNMVETYFNFSIFFNPGVSTLGFYF